MNYPSTETCSHSLHVVVVGQRRVLSVSDGESLYSPVLCLMTMYLYSPVLCLDV